MTEIKIACLLVGGPTLRIIVGSKWFLFEMHPYCGPMPVTKSGNGCETPPSRAFLEAVTFWDQQGQRMSNDGECVWQHPPTFTHLYKPIGKTSHVATRESIAAEKAWEKQLQKWNSTKPKRTTGSCND